ncbi:MAG TPA: hypothetical protein VMT88_02935 [Actinomycetes bacterium]|nr:hypothetical protein [Actinomycetes bacterium]
MPDLDSDPQDEAGGLGRQLAVLDIDGVLADVRHRLHHLDSRPKNWDAFFGDAPDDPLLEEGLEVALDLARGHDIVYLTGRPERCRLDTQTWLDRYGFPAGVLVMRRDTDRRPARMTKLEELNRLSRTAPVALLIDDDDRVVWAAVGAGYLVRHATWMYQERHEQQTLYDAQESEGRT